jgi:uroporphyrin-III C-methyltransferase/precorrin-2 dehydrogenase/sirohydrochlorin ferrochelatase
MNFLPVFMNIRERRCLVVGGGEVATRKTALLRDAGAHVHIVSPQLDPQLQAWVAEGVVTHREGSFVESDVDDSALIIAATDNHEVNLAVHAAATAHNIPVNVVDNPKLCNFIVPSIIDRSPVVAAISTGGASPVLARLLRSRLETFIPSAYGRLARMTADFRDRVKNTFSEPADRRLFWERMLHGPVTELVLANQDDEARARIEKALDDPEAFHQETGEVYLVGGGPGDPDLLTFRALRLMQQADVIVHDRLVSKEVMDLCRRDAERIYVGKERDKHALPQEDINLLLVRLAKEGKRVCRLKGGDPFIFGRGGEEIETLMQEGVPFQVVPGITAASGAASYSGIPLTHRDCSQSVTFVTGHLKDGTMNLNWPALAQPNQTVVFYMGLVGVKVICSELQAHGLPADTPIALVQKATTREQRIYTGTLESMPDIVDKSDIKPPTLIIVGKVVSLRDKLNWYDSESHWEDKPETVV